jgi:transcription termination factor Rho
VILVLIAERPEDVTELDRALPIDLFATTFDEPDTRHVQVAEIAIEHAKRLVEHKRDVVVLFDSLTRLARAANTVVTPSGRTVGNALDVAAVRQARRVLGAARAVEEGGSLTVVATVQTEARTDPGSRTNDAIFDELRGPENLTLVTSREAAERGLAPALDLPRCGTHRVELMLSPEERAERDAWRVQVDGDVEAAIASVRAG